MHHRRQWLRGAATCAASLSLPWLVSSKALGLGKEIAASNKITLGVIGCGPRCIYDLKSILKLADVQVVAICDVQASRRDAGKQLVDAHYGNTDCQTLADFQELLARADVDAVLIATGDRWHAAASIAAAEAGKDVYSEKPCGITIADCQRLDDTFRKTKRIFQAGTQRRSVSNFRAAVKMAQSGKLGTLQSLEATVYIPTLDNTWLPGQPTPPSEICDWNRWLGPAPWRPYNEAYVQGRWRGQYDFDSGARLLDWGAHTLDLCQWAHQSDDTVPVHYQPNPENIVCTYADGVTLTLDFLKEPFGDRGPRWITRLGTCPVRFNGDAGTIETGDSGEIVASSAELQAELDSQPRVSGLDVGTHARDFIDCVKSRQETICNSRVMRRSHVACHAAALAWILQRPLTIDPVTETFTDDEANRLCSRPARNWA